MNLIFTNFWWPFFDWYIGKTVDYHKLVDIWVAQEGCIHSIQGFTFKQQSLFHIMYFQQIMYESHAKLFSKFLGCRPWGFPDWKFAPHAAAVLWNLSQEAGSVVNGEYG